MYVKGAFLLALWTSLCSATTCVFAQPRLPPVCSIADGIAGATQVHHVGAYSGNSSLGAAIELDDLGHEVKKIDVLANLPGKTIVLVLSAYDPVVWNVAWTPGTRIAAALVSGSHGQAIVGIPKSIALYVRTSAGKFRGDGAITAESCPVFAGYRQDAQYGTTAAIIEQLVGRSVTRFTPVPEKGITVVGEPVRGSMPILESSPDYRLAQFVIQRRPDEIPPGRSGMEELAKRGYVRHARQHDIDAFLASGARGIVIGMPIYVVLKRYTMPDALYGGLSVTILVPAGAPMPDGPRGHNSFVLYGKSKCIGPICE